MRVKFGYLAIILCNCLCISLIWGNTCPALNSITRLESSYDWQTSAPGWQGFFNYPSKGRGRSYSVQYLSAISWVKLQDSATSPGYIQCDYEGDVKMEIIRFVQNTASSATQPDTSLNSHWQCEHTTAFPGIACTCTSSIEKCNFELS